MLDLGQQLDHPAQHGVGSRAAHQHFQQAVDGEGSRKDRAARSHVLMHGLAGDRRLIDRGASFEHSAVDGDPLARPDQDLVSRPQVVGVDALLHAVAPAYRVACSQRANAVDRRARSQRAALFKEPAELQQQRDEGGRGKLPLRGGGQHRDRDKLVGSPARVSGDDAADA